MMRKILTGSLLTAAMVLTGCSGDDAGDGLSKGYLVDSAVTNADYDCVADGEFNKTTGVDGSFQCRNMSRVRFRVGKLTLGEIEGLPSDGYVFPQDLIGGDLSDPRVITLAQLLQSLDEDGNVTNGITIPDAVKTSLEEGAFDPEKLITYLGTVPQERHRTQTEALAHLRETVRAIRGNASSANGNGSLIDVNSYPVSTLTQDLKDAIAYMGNEERLAHDVYLNLYDYHADNGTEIYQLQNIAINSETRHIQTIQALVEKYALTEENLTNVDTPAGSADNLPSGEYDISAIQDLYDALYAKGQTSQQDALEVGCMVEVTDINDLNEKIELAKDSNATDVEAAFTALRDASYNHYWAFDSGLKSMDVSDGCCALGTVDGVNYCHEEYPQNSQRGGQGGIRN